MTAGPIRAGRDEQFGQRHGYGYGDTCSPRSPRWRAVEFPVVGDPRGNLTAIEASEDVPFEIARVYYSYNIPDGAVRGGHAHRSCEELVLPLSGSFDVVVDDGAQRERVHLDRSYRGLYIPGLVWRALDNFSTGAVCLVLASEHYDADDYIRDYEGFLEACVP